MRAEGWRPSAAPDALRARAALLTALRAYFAKTGVLEVETPILGRAANCDPQLEPMAVTSADGRRWLHTSPEFPMKRLLASGSGPIYQICKVFRAGERGRNHNPEFTLLEWYRPGWDHLRLMDDVATVIRLALGRPGLPLRRITYRDAMREAAAIDPWTVTDTELAKRAADLGAGSDLSRDAALDLVMAVEVVPRLEGQEITMIHAFPVSQAALARVDETQGYPSARRFEAFVGGCELANGYHELSDPEEQAERIQDELSRRRRAGQPLPEPDAHLLEALRHGLPDCAGVALGVDRLLMLATGAPHIDAVLAFPAERA